MTTPDLDAIRRAYPPADGRTHWQGCELSHPLCAVAVLVAEVERLRKHLLMIQQWDCLNPPRSELCHDHPWLKQVVDAALEEKGGAT